MNKTVMRKIVSITLSLALIFAVGAPIGPVTVFAAGPFSPQISFSSPANMATVTEPTNIVGTVSGTGAASYTLEYALGSDAFIQDAPDIPYIQFASGAAPITNSTLGLLDTTNMLNGYYLLRLTVENGRVAGIVNMKTK